MVNKMTELLKSNEWAVVSLFVLFFILIRIPGVHLPLHQDEYKWPIIVNPENISDINIPHPPLSLFIYRTAGEIVGFNVNFRLVPLFFGTLNLVLLYYFMRALFGKKEAVIASLIWTLSYFSVLASLMVDTDGEILPFFFLLSLIFYYKFRQASIENHKYLWGVLLLVSFTLGFLVKVSFLLAIGAIIADFLWSKKNYLSKADIFHYSIKGVLGIVGLIVILIVSQKIFPFFNLSKSLEYWEHFAVFDRGWFQTAIQCVKALLYTSPFLVLTPLFFKEEKFSRVRPLIFFLIFAFIFYVILFDFSIGALDRYLQLVVLPLTVLSSIVISKVFSSENKRIKEFLLIGSILALVIVFLQSLPHYVPPLHPKSDWIGRVVNLRWNFVYPFSGGSGPLGFYVSFIVIGLSWVVSLSALIFSRIKTDYKRLMVVFILPISLVYNGIFIEEYLFGFWNGNAPKLLNSAIEYVKNDDSIKMVTTYNDNGGNELQEIEKYRKRLYVDPKFDVAEKISTMNKYKEHYFVLDVPHLDPNSVYQKYFNSCKSIYNKVDKKISAIIYDCRNIPDIKL